MTAIQSYNARLKSAKAKAKQLSKTSGDNKAWIVRAAGLMVNSDFMVYSIRIDANSEWQLRSVIAAYRNGKQIAK